MFDIIARKAQVWSFYYGTLLCKIIYMVNVENRTKSLAKIAMLLKKHAFCLRALKNKVDINYCNVL